jgi:hypothetical protein
MQTKYSNIFRQIITRYIPGLLVLYFLVFTGFNIHSMRSTLSDWNNSGTGSADTLRYSSDEWELMHEKAFLMARLTMSGSDSIGLTLNLKDSLIQLEMRGVVLRQVKFDRKEISGFFKGLKPHPYVDNFSKPFAISEIEGTIEKNPVIYRKVPKDTLEAAQTKVEVDTSKVEFVEWHLLLDSALLVSIVQTDQSEKIFDFATFNYRLRRHFKTLSSANRDVIRMKKPQFYPEITIFIPANEAKSFFRALPPNGQVVLRL